MAVRLKLKIRVSGYTAEEVALLNSGYEAPTPQLLVPISLAAKLGLWPPKDDEPLINDKLAEELEIAVEAFGRGLWRFSWEPKEKVRESWSR
jgi:hypothetical protein